MFGAVISGNHALRVRLTIFSQDNPPLPQPTRRSWSSLSDTLLSRLFYSSRERKINLVTHSALTDTVENQSRFCKALTVSSLQNPSLIGLPPQRPRFHLYKRERERERERETPNLRGHNAPNSLSFPHSVFTASPQIGALMYFK